MNLMQRERRKQRKQEMNINASRVNVFEAVRKNRQLKLGRLCVNIEISFATEFFLLSQRNKLTVLFVGLKIPQFVQEIIESENC